MKHNEIALCALVSTLAAGLFVGCGDDPPGNGSGGGAGDSSSGGTSAGGSAGHGPANESGAGGGDVVPETLCAEFGSLCHPYDLGPGPQHECHELGHSGDEELCLAEEEACREACETATEIPFSLDFAAKVGDEPFSCESTYMGLGADDSTVHPTDFKFYVHDIRLIDESGTEVAVTLTQDNLWQHEGVALLDFEDKSGDCSNGTAETNANVVGTVPFGKYVGVVFKLGVPFELNHTDIATAPSPLNLSSMFWGWTMGRLFLAISNSTELEDETRFETLLHLGSVGCTGNPAMGGVEACAKPNRPEYRFPMFRPGQNVLVADMKEALQTANLKTDVCHSFQDVCAEPLEALGLDWETGEPGATQHLFRME